MESEYLKVSDFKNN